MQRITWISGWGINPESLRPTAEQFLPAAGHAFVPPTDRAAEAAGASDWVVGWSLGAWCVLRAAADGFLFRGRVLLLAPFVAFGAEFGLGGRCSRTQVRWLRRGLERSPRAALQDFYQRAGLDPQDGELPYAMADLRCGLDWLELDASPAMRRFAAAGLPANWCAFVGDADPLLDARAVAASLPGCAILAGAGHGLRSLLAAGQLHGQMGEGTAPPERTG